SQTAGFDIEFDDVTVGVEAVFGDAGVGGQPFVGPFADCPFPVSWVDPLVVVYVCAVLGEPVCGGAGFVGAAQFLEGLADFHSAGRGEAGNACGGDLPGAWTLSNLLLNPAVPLAHSVTPCAAQSARMTWMTAATDWSERSSVLSGSSAARRDRRGVLMPSVRATERRTVSSGTSRALAM